MVRINLPGTLGDSQRFTATKWMLHWEKPNLNMLSSLWCFNWPQTQPLPQHRGGLENNNPHFWWGYLALEGAEQVLFPRNCVCCFDSLGFPRKDWQKGASLCFTCLGTLSGPNSYAGGQSLKTLKDERTSKNNSWSKQQMHGKSGKKSWGVRFGGNKENSPTP